MAIKENKKLVGEVLAQFYCGGVYDEDVLGILLKEDTEGNHVYDYIRFLIWKGIACLNDILKKVKDVSDNENLIVYLILLEIIEDNGNAIIAYKNDAIKTAYWSRSLRLWISEKASEKVCLWLVQIIYKSDEDRDIVDKEKSDLANKVYSGFD